MLRIVLDAVHTALAAVEPRPEAHSVPRAPGVAPVAPRLPPFRTARPHRRRLKIWWRRPLLHPAPPIPN